MLENGLVPREKRDQLSVEEHDLHRAREASRIFMLNYGVLYGFLIVNNFDPWIDQHKT